MAAHAAQHNGLPICIAKLGADYLQAAVLINSSLVNDRGLVVIGKLGIVAAVAGVADRFSSIKKNNKKCLNIWISSLVLI